MTFQGGENLTQNTQNGPGAGVPVGFEYFEDDSGRVKSLLAELQSAGVVLSIKDDQLVFDAPAKAMTDDLLARLRVDRPGLVEALRVPMDQGDDDQGDDDQGGDPPASSSSGRPKVVHLKRGDFDPHNPAHVRIDRQTKWGNRFQMDKPGRPADGDRAEVIRKYRAWVVGQAELMAALPELRGKVLGCWCAPAACHGDVLADLVEALDDEATPDTSIQCPPPEIDLQDDPDGLPEPIDPDSVPTCPGCGRWCDVMTAAEAWHCSRCDPGADERRRRTVRVLAFASRGRLRSVGCDGRPNKKTNYRREMPGCMVAFDDPVAGVPCERCRSVMSHLIPVHAGMSLRRDCSGCGRFIENPVWYDADAAAFFVAGLKVDPEGDRCRAFGVVCDK